MRIASLLILLAAACGPSSTPAPAEPTEHAEHAEHAGHPTLTPAMTAFHDVLAPVWHAEPGDGRNALACEGEFTALADGIEAAGTPPGVDAEVWASQLSVLRMAINDLDGPCTGGTAEQGAMPVPDALERVHSAFHGLMEALPAS